MSHRAQSRDEEFANSFCHGAALLAVMAAIPFLVEARRRHEAASSVGIIVFLVTMVSLFLASSLYHAAPTGRLKQLFEKLDHCAIYCFIAGSYTPFALSAADGARDYVLLGMVWTLALTGALLKACNRLTNSKLSTSLYVLMGWLVLLAALPLLGSAPSHSLSLLLAGGAAYTTGVIFFALDSRLRYGHTVWHGFVVAGSGFHLFAVLGHSA